MTSTRCLASLAAAFLGGVVISPAQDKPEDWFPFAIPVLADKAPAFDLRGLNEKVAGENGWLHAEGERFVDGKGRTFRIFGTNLTAEGAFPEPDKAGPLARHLARLGYNMVRLHFLDNQWGPGVPSLTPESNNVARDGLRAEGLARLDRFVAELKSAGVRINLNLHVGRHYPGWKEGLPQFSKGLDNFMPDEIAELKTYSRALLTHVNPLTGLAYKDDPAVSVLEISNEDSLVNGPGWLSKLPEPYAGELRRQWVEWLRQKHGTTARLQAEWGLDTGPVGPEIAPVLGKWMVETHEGAASTVTPLEGANGIRWEATKPGGESWHLQFQSGKVPLVSGKSYEVRFRARSASHNDLNVYCAEAGGDWAMLGLFETVKLAEGWNSFAFRLAPPRVNEAAGARLVFSLLNKTGTVEIADFSCREVSGGYLKPDQTLEAANIPFAAVGVPEKVRGQGMEFLSDIEIRFASGMRDFLKKELGCRALVANTQVLFGGPLGARRELRVSDFIDTHGYWQHPDFPGGGWDMKNWRIENTSQIASADGGTLAEMAMQRPPGKPYTVSEYDLPAPSDYAAEMWPMYAAMAGFQGWAGLYHYTFAHGGKDYSTDRLTGFFNGAVHPAKDGLRPAAAVMFRLGLVAPARERRALRVGEGDLISLGARLEGNMWGAWRTLWKEGAGMTGALALRHGAGLDIQPGEAKAALPGAKPDLPPQGLIESDTGEWSWDRAQDTWVLKAPAARVWTGRIGGRAWPAGDTTLKVPALSEPVPHATVVLVALDGKPLAESRKLLLTALRRAENPGMAWNEKRTSVSDQWGGGPVQVLGVEADLSLPPGTKWTVTPLDAEGQRREPSAKGTDSLAIRPSARTIWWMIERE